MIRHSNEALMNLNDFIINWQRRDYEKNLPCNLAARAANSNSKELDHFATLELELEKIFFLNSNLNSHKTVRVH